MTVQQLTHADPTGDCPPPVSLETIAVIEQVLAHVLGSLRDSITASRAQHAGAVEYESWLRGRDR